MHCDIYGPAFHRLACERGLEGIVSKRTNGRYEPDRRTLLKIKCLNREEFVVVGWRRLRPLAVDKMPLAEPPPRGSRFGSPLVLSRVHWVRPEMVVEVSYA